jgi:Family of unknown function (DUF5990)
VGARPTLWPEERGAPRHRFQLADRARRSDNELLALHPGDAPSAVWILECTTVARSTGVDIKGPYIQGRPRGRFIYLSWGTVDAAGAFTLFRRAKLLLDAISPDVLDAAVQSGRLVARLGLIDAEGHPLCALVRPPLVDWFAAPTGLT